MNELNQYLERHRIIWRGETNAIALALQLLSEIVKSPSKTFLLELAALAIVWSENITER